MIRCKPEDIIGQTVVGVLHTRFRQSETESIPGLTSGVWVACDFVLRLGNGKLIGLGVFRDSQPLTIIDPTTELADFEWPESMHSCVGDEIVDVLVCELSEQIYLYLSSKRYLWIELEDGTTLNLESEAYFTEDGADSALKMKTYWGDIESPHGGRHLLD